MLLFTFAAGAQTLEPPFQLRGQKIERLDAEHLVATGQVEIVVPGTTIKSDEAAIQLNADKTTDIRPTGNVVVTLAKSK